MVGAATIGYAFLMLVRPVLMRQPASPDQREQAHAIVARHGRSALARLTLLPDKAYFLSAGGTAIAFVVKGRVALALGDPIGPPEDFSRALDEFKAYCARNDWQAVFYQVLPDHLSAYSQAGYSSLCIGQEAVVHLEHFSLEGKTFKPFRNTLSKMARLGICSEMHDPPLRVDFLDELRTVSDEWLTMVHGTEKRFSVGWFDEDYLGNSQVMTVSDANGALLAFANILPEYQRSEASLDLMRRRKDVESGTMDFLFVALLQWAKRQGYESFSLGLSALAGVGERDDDPAAEKALHYIFDHINQFYNFKGLHSYKEKFLPEWCPRYLIYPGAASLPAVAMALVRADSGDDFLGEFLKS